MAFKNFVSPHVHIQSLDSASTPKAFADREMELETGHITVTDHGTLQACRQVYDLCQEKAYKGKLKPILGLEAYVRDENCSILLNHGIQPTKTKEGKDTFLDYNKYYHITLHAQDQIAYEKLVKLLSKADSRAEKHGSERKPLFDWNDLEEIGSTNTTMTSGCLIGMVQRHLIGPTGARPDIAEAYYSKLRSLAKPGNFFVEVFPHVCDRNWNQAVFVTFNTPEGEKTERFQTWKKVKTAAGAFSMEDLGKECARNGPKRFQDKHKAIYEIMNNRKWIPYESVNNLISAEHKEGFIKNDCTPEAPDGDIQYYGNKFVLEMAKKYNDPVIISDDSHFATPDEKIIQDIRLMSSGGAWRFSTSYHRQSSNDAWQYFSKKLLITERTFEGWLENNAVWASKFNDFKFEYKVSLPTRFFPSDTLQETYSLIDKHGRMDWTSQVHKERLESELQLLHKNGKIDLLSYFFIDEGICSFYESQGKLTGPGRGSAAGLLLSYLEGITHVDPLKFNLSQERFITQDRIDSGALPDIDQDLSDRDILLNPETGYLWKRFGKHAVQISTDTMLRLRSSVRDVSRVTHGHVLPEVEGLAKKFLETPQGVSDKEFVFGREADGSWVKGTIETDPALKAYVNKYPKEWAIVQKLLGLSRSKGRHPCAFAISNEPITNNVPTTSVSDIEVTQYTFPSVEATGLVKMDFLGVNSLKDIENCMKLIQSKHLPELTDKLNSVLKRVKAGEEYVPSEASVIIDGKRVPIIRVLPFQGKLVDIWDLPEDQSIFNDICEGKTETVFQLSTPSAVKWLKEFNYVKKEENGKTYKVLSSIEDLAAFVALDRNGPLDVSIDSPEGGTHNALVEYARRSRGDKPAVMLKVFDELFPETFGVMCIAKGQLVKTLDGLCPIEKVKKGQFVQTEDGSYQEVLNTLNKGIKNTLKVRLTNGEELFLTSDHKVLTNRGWVEAGLLTKKDLIKQFWSSDEFIPDGDDRDWLIGLLLADGDLCATTPNVCCGTRSFARKVKRIADKAFGLNCKIYFHTRAWYCSLRNKPKSGTIPNPLNRYLYEIGIKNLDCYTKRFPEKISKSMLAGFFEGAGCVENNSLRVCNYALAHRFFEGLQASRIVSSFFLDKEGVWTVKVQGDLPLRIKKYYRNFRMRDFVPNPGILIPGSDEDRQLMKKPFWGRAVAQRLSIKYPFEVSKDLWGKVNSINPGDDLETYDLSIRNVHSFVVGGSVVHNCYQEQMQKAFQVLTGCSGAEAESFRRDVAKKKADKIQKIYPVFMETAGAKLGKAVAQTAWDFFGSWASYGFNKSHAVCYATISYACAYLKHHFPLEWWTAVLGNASKEEINNDFWRHCGHLIDLPDVNMSGNTFFIRNNKIQAPISLLHGVGDVAHAELCELRPFTTLEDFCLKIENRRVKNATTIVEKVVLEKLTKKQEKEGLKIGQEIEVTKTQKARSALTRAVAYPLIISGAMDSLFPDSDPTGLPLNIVDKLMLYESAQAMAQGKSKPQPIDEKFIKINGISRYQMQKKILPAYTEDLPLLLLSHQVPGLKREMTGAYSFVHESRGSRRTLRVASLNDLKKLTEMKPWPVDYTVLVAVPSSVEDSRVFQYTKDGNTKEAMEFTFDIEGSKERFVLWGRDKGRVPLVYKKQSFNGSMVMAILSKRNENRPFSVEDVILIQNPLALKEDD